ncbi:MAG: group II intron reverse transcriptase/maturase [Deltaproteobacteria bacterium]
MIEELKPKTQPVSKEQVWSAWKHIKKGGKGMGIDQVSIREIEANPRKYLYPLWNRLASGSYFPPPVKEVPIPKGEGKVRMLGIPTILDRVAQQVIREELEKIIEPLFHPSSFGYRPGRSAHDALEQCAKNCWERWYVVDLDIKGFFDNIDHGQMMRILQKYTSQKQILLYCERWLKAPVYKQDGELQARSKGTPQGGVISPLLANLYLHDAFDQWLADTQPRIVFERYADDIVIHTRSIEQSNFILDKLKARLAEYSLEIHPDKTKIVYCYRTARFFKEGKEIPVSFDFLGFTFKPRICEKSDGEKFWGFRPAISKKSEKKIVGKLRDLAFQGWVSMDIHDLANALAPRIQGWLNYYGKFRISEMGRVFWLLNRRIARWARWKYKLRTFSKSYGWLKRMMKWYPNTFVHWKYGFTF